MTVPKILGTVTSCGICPKRTDDRCSLVDARIIDRDIVAPFCPLTDYPSRVIADQQAMIESLRRPHKWSMSLAIITHVAAKLGRVVNSERVTTLNIPYRRGSEECELCLDFEYITDIDLRGGFGIIFRYREDIFKLYPDNHPPQLSVRSKSNPDWWEPCEVIM